MTIEVLTKIIDRRRKTMVVSKLWLEYKKKCKVEGVLHMDYLDYAKQMVVNGYRMSIGARDWVKQ